MFYNSTEEVISNKKRQLLKPSVLLAYIYNTSFVDIDIKLGNLYILKGTV